MTKKKYIVKPTINIRAIEADWDWQSKSACKDQDTSLFFYEDNERGEIKDKRIAAAKQICDGCSVKTQCLEFALQIKEDYGIWGGLTPEERYTIRRRRQRNKVTN